MPTSASHLEWLSRQPESVRLEYLIRDHAEPVYGFGYRALGGVTGTEARCRCGEWFPSHAHNRHVAEALIAAGVMVP